MAVTGMQQRATEQDTIAERSIACATPLTGGQRYSLG
jgi:hypothetical protein